MKAKSVNESKQKLIIVGDEVAGEIYKQEFEYDDSDDAKKIMNTYNEKIIEEKEEYEIYADEMIDGVRVIGYLSDVLFWFFLTDDMTKVESIIQSKPDKFDNIIEFID